jgi:hypothetical protein
VPHDASPDDVRKVGAILSRAYEEAGYTSIEDAAKKAKVNPRTFTRVINGGREGVEDDQYVPARATIIRMARGVKMEWVPLLKILGRDVPSDEAVSSESPLLPLADRPDSELPDALEELQADLTEVRSILEVAAARLRSLTEARGPTQRSSGRQARS